MENSSSHAQNYFNSSENTRVLGIPIKLYLETFAGRILYFMTQPEEYLFTRHVTAHIKGDVAQDKISKSSPEIMA
jgi:hypothetical protein